MLMELDTTCAVLIRYVINSKPERKEKCSGNWHRKYVKQNTQEASSLFMIN